MTSSSSLKKNVPPVLPSRGKTTSSIPKKYECDWFYLDDKLQPKGPVTFNQVRDMFKKSELTKDSYVFGPEDMQEWKQMSEITELMNILKI